MNILVIGNGFDLAHGLPTRYTDFLEWIKAEYALYVDLREQHSDVPECNVNWAICASPSKIKVNHLRCREKQLEVWECISKNFWVDYFLNCSRYLKENWIDFEKEISDIVQSIDSDMRGKKFDGQIDELSKKCLRDGFLYKGMEALFTIDGKQGGKQNISFRELRDILYEDLNRCIRVLEIYLAEYVDKIEIQEKSPDIDAIEIDHVLSFNYTNTFSKLYKATGRIGEDETNIFDYIHGKADTDNTIKSSNMVVGIDEYLSDDRKNKDIEFIAFKKFYQRIHKQTGCQYKEWLDEIKQDYLNHLHRLEKVNHMEQRYFPDDIHRMFNEFSISALKDEKCPIHNLYIFGHSLDITDKDILRDLILNDNVHTTIFYLNKDVMGQQIANLVKVIGQDELIKRTGGGTKTIEFRQQQDMVPITDMGIN